MENNDLYIPFIQHINESGTSKIEGTRENPNFLYTSNGGRAKSVIFHTEEDGKLYQYHKNSVNMNDVNLYCMYRKNKRANCRAEFKIKPENDDLTYKRKINGKTRYFCQTKSSKMIKAAQIGKRLSILAVMSKIVICSKCI